MHDENETTPTENTEAGTDTDLTSADAGDSAGTDPTDDDISTDGVNSDS